MLKFLSYLASTYYYYPYFLHLKNVKDGLLRSDDKLATELFGMLDNGLTNVLIATTRNKK